MAETVIIGGFDNNALNILDRYLGKNVGTTKNNIVSNSNLSNDSSNPDDRLSKIDDQLDKLKQKIADNETNLRETKTKKYREQVETDAKLRTEWRKLLKGENEEYREQIKLLEIERKLTEDEIRYNHIINQDWELRNKLIAQHNKYVKENLEKYEAIAAQKEKIATYGQKVDDKVETLSHGNIFGGEKGRKNSFAEINTMVGNLFKNVQSSFKGETVGRILGKSAAGLFGATSKAANFIASDKQVSISDVGGKIANVAGMMGPWGKAAGALIQGLTSAVEMADRINKSASDYTRSVGGGVAKMKQMRTQATNIASAISQWGDKAYKSDKILEHTAELSKETGRVMDHMSNMDFKSLEDLRQWGIDSSVLNQFDTFGLSMETIDKRIKSIYNTSGKQGLNAKAVTDAMTKNLKMAQNYTFAGGLRSLERMAQKSVALKYNMEAVSRFADKVSTLEGAATAGAQLSVLGGDFAKMGNPLTMLYGGLQDVEQLNEMMLNMTKNMAQWDSNKGQMEITAYNRQRLRAAADAMGVDYSELVNQAMTQGKRNRIDNQLDIAGRVNDDTTREYIKNIAQLDEKGKGYVVFHENGGERRVDVDKLTENDKEKLKEESKRYSDEQNAKLGDVLSQTRTITEQLNDLIDTLRARIAKGIISIYNWLDRRFGNGDNQIDITTVSMSSGQKNDYETLQKVRNNGNFTGLSTGEIDRLNTTYGIKNASQVLGKSNDELSNMVTENVQNRAFGGEIRGKGTSKSDSILAFSSGGAVKLSDGEYVVNAKAAQKHMSELKTINADGYVNGGLIKTGNNPYNYQSVNETSRNSRSNSLQIQPVSIDPINININGTINLTGGGNTKSLDIKDVLNNPSIIAQLVRKIEESINYRLDKRNVHMKYPEPILLA